MHAPLPRLQSRAGWTPRKALRQMRDFAETLAASGDLRELLMNPSLEMAQKLKVLDAIARKIGMFPQVRNFLAVILEHHRLDDLNEILTRVWRGRR